MNKPQRSWEGAILLFAISVTAITGLLYHLMLLYVWTIPWFVWALIVIGCAAATFVPLLRNRKLPE